MGRVTLQSIADKTGVSRMTVSNAFSRPDQLSAELREKILKAAEELGYVGPDPSARALARGAVGAVGLLLTDRLSDALKDAFATAFLASVADALSERGLALTVLTPGGATAGSVPARDVAMDGALVYICDWRSPDIAWLRKRDLPLVGVDQPPDPDYTGINVDDEAGARAAVQHLLELGHRRFGILTIGAHEQEADGNGSYAAAQRMVGWTGMLEEAAIEPVVVRSHFLREESAKEGALKLLDRTDRPTAVLCFSDAFAAAVVRAAGQLGLGVPEDVSVVGFDDSPLAPQVQPPLTTVRQDVDAKGEAAVAALVEVMQARKAGPPMPAKQIMIPTELVVRESTGPAPAV